jgi:hypothetical protein
LMVKNGSDGRQNSFVLSHFELADTDNVTTDRYVKNHYSLINNCGGLRHQKKYKSPDL